MNEAGTRRRGQPAPPRVVFEALTTPDQHPARPWLLLLADERRPDVVEAVEPGLVVWSSLWDRRPDASHLGHLRRRINELVNANLRYTFGQ